MKHVLLLVLPFVSAINTDAQDKEVLKDLLNLKGVWKMKSTKGATYEEWRVVSDSLLLGRSYKLKGSDTMLLETVNLTKTKDGTFYIVSVKNQHSQNPVSFKMIANTNTSYTFENKENDFPQRIIYKIVSPDSLFARIEGTTGGKNMSSDLNFTRVQ